MHVNSQSEFRSSSHIKSVWCQDLRSLSEVTRRLSFLETRSWTNQHITPTPMFPRGLTRLFCLKTNEPNVVCNLAPTYVGHLRHSGAVGPLVKDRRVVIDVLHANDELGRGFQGAVRLPVGGRGDEPVLVLLFAVQRLGDVDVARLLVDHEDGARPLAS